MRIYFNDAWKFEEKYNGERVFETGQDVRLPHTCKETPFHYFDEEIYQMVCGYGKRFVAEKSWEGKRVFLTFEGVAHACEVYVNNKKRKEHHCGYTAVTIDLTEHLSYGMENEILVKVDSRETQNIPPFGHVIDYMTYGGIYRDVYLEIKNKKHIQDVFLYSKENILHAEIEFADAECGDVIALSMRKKGEACYTKIHEQVCSGNKEKIEAEAGCVEKWDVDEPNLYEVKLELFSKDTIVDERVEQFGFRSMEFKKDGFYLNGRKIRIRGLNRHQSYAYVGYAMPESMQKRDADILKWELGLNAVRTSHYPQSHYFLDRCDEIGLLVFTEIPGWQHIGDDAWKAQACENTREMVMQYRNHPSIMIWGVRINESVDDDPFYRQTNEIAHRLDPTRATGGVRAHKKSSLLEDVYTYNDFVHDGRRRGCEPKKRVTSDQEKAYLVTEYNGHMFPTKMFDCEEHRLQHALRHAKVLNAAAGETDLAGSFGWCMADYNTHKDFGSGDRICYHGVLDMFRNPKLAAAVYSSQQEKMPVLEISSSMDIGEHPASMLGDIYMFTNADSVRVYKNDFFLKEYDTNTSQFQNLTHGPIAFDDFVGTMLEEKEGFGKDQSDAVKAVLNTVAKYGLSNVPKIMYLKMIKLILKYRMTIQQVTDLYTKYVGNWGGEATIYRFEAIKQGNVVSCITRVPMKQVCLKIEADHHLLKENHSYDVAAVRIQAADEHGNRLPYYQEPVLLRTEGPIQLIGPSIISLKGGMGGTYVKTTGEPGTAVLWVNEEKITFEIR